MDEKDVLWNYVEAKFKSGNGVEVERITLTRKELDVIKESVLKKQTEA